MSENFAFVDKLTEGLIDVQNYAVKRFTLDLSQDSDKPVSMFELKSERQGCVDSLLQKTHDIDFIRLRLEQLDFHVDALANSEKKAIREVVHEGSFSLSDQEIMKRYGNALLDNFFRCVATRGPRAIMAAKRALNHGKWTKSEIKEMVDLLEKEWKK